LVTALPAKDRPRRLTDRIAGRALVLALDPRSTTGRVAEAVAAGAEGNHRLLEHAAGRVHLDALERPSPAAHRAHSAVHRREGWHACSSGDRWRTAVESKSRSFCPPTGGSGPYGWRVTSTAGSRGPRCVGRLTL